MIRRLSETLYQRASAYVKRGQNGNALGSDGGGQDSHPHFVVAAAGTGSLIEPGVTEKRLRRTATPARRLDADRDALGMPVHPAHVHRNLAAAILRQERRHRFGPIPGYEPHLVHAPARQSREVAADDEPGCVVLAPVIDALGPRPKRHRPP